MMLKKILANALSVVGLLVTGCLAGAFSLSTSLLFQPLFTPFSLLLKTGDLLFLSVLEELIKLTFLFFALPFWSKKDYSWQRSAWLGFLLGIGFGLFELLLISLHHYRVVPFFAIVWLFLIHSVTGLLLGISIWFFQRKKSSIAAWLFLGLPIILHLCYNGFVQKINRF